jgi:hypothetical protein
MSSEGAISSLAAIEQLVIQQKPQNANATIAEYSNAANQALSVQRFELGLDRAVEDGSMSVQEVEESRRRTTEVAHRDKMESQDIPAIEMRPWDTDGGMANQALHYLEGFHDRVSGFEEAHAAFPGAVVPKQRELRLVHNVSAPAAGSQLVQAPSAASLQSSSEAAIHMLERTFEFAVEAQLVSNVAQQSEKVLNNLMKGQ